MNTQKALDESIWYNLMMTGNACDHAKNCAETIIKHAGLLSKHPYEAVAGSKLAKAGLALSEALLAVQIARASYERVTAENAAAMKVAVE